MALRHPSTRRRSPIPTLWLITDERMGERLWTALATLPTGSGVMFRHFATDTPTRTAIFARIERLARRRRLIVVQAGAKRQPVAIRAAHSLREAAAARRAGGDLVLVSPIYPTRTHPGERSLGPLRAGAIARAAKVPAIALGGMTASRFRRVKALGFVGWAAIDGLTPHR